MIAISNVIFPTISYNLNIYPQNFPGLIVIIIHHECATGLAKPVIHLQLFVGGPSRKKVTNSTFV